MMSAPVEVHTWELNANSGKPPLRLHDWFTSVSACVPASALVGQPPVVSLRPERPRRR